MYIFGASGQGKVIASILKSIGVDDLKGFIDDTPPSDEVFGLPVLHSSSIHDFENQTLIVGIGNNATRKKVAERLNASYFSAIHPSAAICKSVVLGAGTVVMPNAVVNADTVIGKHGIINSGAVVEHDCVLGDYVHISPNAALAGNTEIGEGSHIGIVSRGFTGSENWEMGYDWSRNGSTQRCSGLCRCSGEYGANHKIY